MVAHKEPTQGEIIGITFALTPELPECKKETQTEFFTAISENNLEKAKRIYFLSDINVFDMEDGFDLACSLNNIEIAQWIYYHDLMSKHKLNAMLYSGFTKACVGNHIDIAKWIYSLDDGVLYGIVAIACHYNSLKVIKWAFTLNKTDVIATTYDFGNACIYCDVEFVKWFFEKIVDKQNIDYETCFINACKICNFEVAKWIYGKNKISAECHLQTLKYAVKYQNRDSVHEIFGLDPINLNGPIGYDLLKESIFSFKFNDYTTIQWLYNNGCDVHVTQMMNFLVRRIYSKELKRWIALNDINNKLDWVAIFEINCKFWEYKNDTLDAFIKKIIG